jgi:hypothetical protein
VVTLHAHLLATSHIQWTSDIRASDIRTLAYRDTPKHVPAKVVLCYPRLLIRTLVYKDTKMLVPAVSLYPRFTVCVFGARKHNITSIDTKTSTRKKIFQGKEKHNRQNKFRLLKKWNSQFSINSTKYYSSQIQPNNQTNKFNQTKNVHTKNA